MARVRKSNKLSKRRGSKRCGSKRLRRGGALDGAPLNYSLAGSEASRSSLSQGGDYLQYHQGQHGGMAPFDGASSVLEASLRGPAHLAGLDKAFAEIQGMQDGGRRRRRGSKRSGSKRSGSKRHGGSKRRGSKRQGGSKQGGSKRRGSKRHGGSKRRGSKRQGGSKRRGSKRQGGNRSRRQRRHGGSLGFSPFPGQGMLLSGAQYAQAGLNPEWKGNAEFEAAAARGAL